MSTFGFTAKPSFRYNWSGLNTDNEIACNLVTIPEAGIIDTLSVYMAGHTASVNMRACIWDNAGILLQQSALTSVPRGTSVPGGQAWHTLSITPINAVALTQYYIGWWRDPLKDAEWSVTNAGTFKMATGGPGNLGAVPIDCAGSAYFCGNIGAYATYHAPISTGVKVMRAGVWTSPIPTKIRRAGVFTATIPVWIYRSGVWVKI